jgi:hypothetical protein
MYMGKNQFERTVLTLLWVITILSGIQFLGFNLANVFGVLQWMR